jgi:hypothetical protein
MLGSSTYRRTFELPVHGSAHSVYGGEVLKSGHLKVHWQLGCASTSVDIPHMLSVAHAASDMRKWMCLIRTTYKNEGKNHDVIETSLYMRGTYRRKDLRFGNMSMQ